MRGREESSHHDERLVARLAAAFRDPGLVVLEGFHAFKHALRFGAVIELAMGSDRAAIEAMAAAHASDLLGALDRLVTWVSPDALARASRSSLSSPLLAVARRPRVSTLASGDAPIVLLERPSHLGNLGACVRVAAGLGAAAVWTLGDTDPWHPTALRGSAGLHFALPVVAIGDLAEVPADRPIVALDPDGTPLSADVDLTGAILAFGTERDGLSPALRRRAERSVAIPMRPEVSSLNLATSVAIALWHWRLVKSLSPVSLS